MNTYFETSAIIKLIADEQGSDDAGALWDASDLIFTSRLSYAEARAALAAAYRARRLSAAELARAKRGLHRRFDEMDAVAVDTALVRAAGDLAERHRLRGYDAVHLASAAAVGRRDVIVATWDAALASACLTERMAVAGLRT